MLRAQTLVDVAVQFRKVRRPSLFILIYIFTRIVSAPHMSLLVPVLPPDVGRESDGSAAEADVILILCVNAKVRDFLRYLLSS
jgi:hypothetical protein